ncbi:MAG: Crp/Fnr family transcriptional regulator [Acidimicrobiales bacterium]
MRRSGLGPVETSVAAAGSPAMWDAIAASGREVRFDAGDTLVRQGEQSTHCYAIRSGEVLVTATTAAGSTVVLGRRNGGSVIGELAALDPAPRSATVTARTDVVAQMLSAVELEALLLDQPALALAELKRLSLQLRSLTERYAVGGAALRTRIVTLLETHRAETGVASLRSTRSELAGWLGASREAVSRVLQELEAEGVVQLGRGWVGLTDR